MTTFLEGSENERRNAGRRATTACNVDRDVEDVAISDERRLYRGGIVAEGTGIEGDRDVGRVIRRYSAGN